MRRKQYIGINNTVMVIRSCLLLSVLLCALRSSVYAQEAKAPHSDALVWKKRIKRNIALPAVENKNGKIMVVPEWDQFFQDLVADAKAMKVPVYSAIDPNKQLDSPTLNDVYSCHLDSIVVTNPITGKDSSYPNIPYSRYDNVVQFRIMEEWTCDARTGRTEIKLTQIAPVKDVYGDDWTFRGSQAMCWIKWDVFQKFLHNYSSFGAEQQLAQYIMADYAADTALIKKAIQQAIYNEKENSWTQSVVRSINMIPDTEAENTLYYYNTYDTSATEQLYRATLTGRISAYGNNNYRQTTALSLAELKETIKTSIDTQVVNDPITSYSTIRIIKRDFCFECVTRYCIKENWTLDMQKGTTSIKYTWVMPVSPVTNDAGEVTGEKPMFWVRYSDARAVLADYTQYHPQQNIEWNIWQERFAEPRYRNPYHRDNR